jgi:hypothetical protein
MHFYSGPPMHILSGVDTLEDDALDGPSLILLHSIPGREYPNIICADCSDTTDWAVVLHVAQALGVGLFTTNVERGEPEC